VPHFIHRITNRNLGPEFLHEERLFLERRRSALHVMERQRDHLVHDIEEAKALARKAHIPIDRSLEQQERNLLALIGVGNRFRHDDGAGLEVARRLRLARPPGVNILERDGEPTSLLEAWGNAREALVVDGVFSDSEPGTLHRFEVADQPLPAELFRPSTHALGVADAVELARELGRLPDRLVVYGIEGESFEVGEGLTAVVESAVARLVTGLYQEFEGVS
jgi:hydrogenase maturation protease